ncbi:DUF1120 domain-containing protein [Enterobacter hormaechei]|uniref:DUF1120 domain-containing protein n=1 Tax=Enterobacter hormaechei TaxID=158836 RepID=UPI003D7DB782
MKNVVLASMLVMFVSSAFAADTAVLKVTGVLTNSSCIPEISGGGVVDYGTIHLSALNTTAINQLGQKDFSLSITCPALTKSGFSVSDDRTGTAPNIMVKDGAGNGNDIIQPLNMFGLNKTAGNVNIGNYTIFVKNDTITADGATVGAIYSADNGTSWSDNGTLMVNDGSQIVSVATVGSTAPVAFKNLVIPMAVSAAIQDTNTLAITDDTNMDGQATFTIKYL